MYVDKLKFNCYNLVKQIRIYIFATFFTFDFGKTKRKFKKTASEKAPIYKRCTSMKNKERSVFNE